MSTANRLPSSENLPQSLTPTATLTSRPNPSTPPLVTSRPCRMHMRIQSACRASQRVGEGIAGASSKEDERGRSNLFAPKLDVIFRRGRRVVVVKAGLLLPLWRFRVSGVFGRSFGFSLRLRLVPKRSHDLIRWRYFWAHVLCVWPLSVLENVSRVIFMEGGFLHVRRDHDRLPASADCCRQCLDARRWPFCPLRIGPGPRAVLPDVGLHFRSS